MKNYSRDDNKIVAVTSGVADMIRCRDTGRVYLTEIARLIDSDCVMYADAHKGRGIEKIVKIHMYDLFGPEACIGLCGSLEISLPFGTPKDVFNYPCLKGDMPEHIYLAYEDKRTMHLLMDSELFPPSVFLETHMPPDYGALRKKLGCEELIIKYAITNVGAGVFYVDKNAANIPDNFHAEKIVVVQKKIDAERMEIEGSEYASWVRAYFTSALFDDGGGQFKVHGLVRELASVPYNDPDRRLAIVANRSTGRERHRMHYPLAPEEGTPYLEFLSSQLSKDFYRLMSQPTSTLLNGASRKAVREKDAVSQSLIQALRGKILSSNNVENFPLYATRLLGGARGLEPECPRTFIPNSFIPSYNAVVARL